MSRPLLQKGVSQLEALFADNGTDIKVLKQLANELQFRQTPRATALLSEVEVAIAKSKSAPPQSHLDASSHSILSPAEQDTAPDLFEDFELAKVSQKAAIKPPSAPPPAHDTSLLSSVRSIDDAMKVLDASPGTPWETIEQNRRRLVSASSPFLVEDLDEQVRTALNEKAKEVNAAYQALFKQRYPGC